MPYEELADYVLNQLSPLDDVRRIAMMGGYIFYYRERVIGGIYHGVFMVKDVPAAREYMPDSVSQPPYEGAGKTRLPVTILDDGERLCAMVESMFDQLPKPRPKPRKQKPEAEKGSKR